MPANTTMPENARASRTLAIDIGGTGIKTIVLGDEGQPVTDRLRHLTPRPAEPARVLAEIRSMLARDDDYERVSVGFPGVVKGGIVHTAPNLGTERWRGYALKKELSEMTRRPVRVLNDADLQGYGVIAGLGVELVITLGTGMGSALFTDGRLVPNLELGHHPLRRGQTYEERISDAERKRIGKARWNRRLLQIIEQLEPIWNYHLLHIGGGNAQRITVPLPGNVHVFTNVQGMTGGFRVWKDDEH